jgi:hypothetical protein
MVFSSSLIMKEKEVQYFTYTHRFSRKDFKINDDALFSANVRRKEANLKQKYLDAALTTVKQELHSRMLTHGVSPERGEGRDIYEWEVRHAHQLRDDLARDKYQSLLNN